MAGLAKGRSEGTGSLSVSELELQERSNPKYAGGGAGAVLAQCKRRCGIDRRLGGSLLSLAGRNTESWLDHRVNSGTHHLCLLQGGRTFEKGKKKRKGVLSQVEGKGDDSKGAVLTQKLRTRGT